MSNITWRGNNNNPFGGLSGMLHATNNGWNQSTQALQQALNNPLDRQRTNEDRLTQAAKDEANLKAAQQAYVTQGMNQEKLQFGLDNQDAIHNADMAQKKAQLVNSQNTARNSNQLFAQRQLEAKQQADQTQANNLYAATRNELRLKNPEMTEDNLDLLASSYTQGHGYNQGQIGNARTTAFTHEGQLSPIQQAQANRAADVRTRDDTIMVNDEKEISKGRNSSGRGGAFVSDKSMQDITRSDLDKSSWNPFKGWDTDSDSRQSATDHVTKTLGKYPKLKIGQATIDNLVALSRRSAGVGNITGGNRDYFDSTIFDKLFKQYANQ